ncbi:hypothetical protein PQX77_013945 [Marasmius sp. AFHP31]|nr:hypothetical protein PQX77_013945 [Marasmius sp. AFHP31]
MVFSDFRFPILSPAHSRRYGLDTASSLSSNMMVPESHFTSLLHTNYVPSAKELKELQDLISEPKERIQRLDQEIHRLQAERDELQQFVDNHSALTSPFRRLPADIWGEIFVHCLPKNKLNVALCTMEEPPLLLTTICRAWREIALSTPRLWSAVHIHFSGIDSDLAAAQMEGIKLWLDRSGSRPLTLSVSISNCAPLNTTSELIDFDSNPCTALMDLLACYSHRWRTLSLDYSVVVPHLRPLERLTRADLPLLENVYIAKFGLVDANFLSDPSIPPREDSTLFATLLPQLPSLRSFHSQPASPAVLALAFTCLRLTQLTLGLSMPPNVMLRQIATSCRALHTLTIDSILAASLENNAATVLFPDEPPMEWPSLQELNLLLSGSGYYTESGTAITFHPVLKSTFDGILTPQLRRLFIQLARTRSRYPPKEDNVPFQSFIASSPHLTHLRISGHNVLNAEALSRCLRFAPSLTTLALRARAPPMRAPRPREVLPRDLVVLPPPEWLKKFLSSFNDLGTCPEIEVLDCGRCRHTEIDSILEFAQTWDRGSSTLKSLRADLGHLYEEEVHAVNSDALVQALSALQETKGISLDLEWKLVEEPTESDFDPSKGMAMETSPWDNEVFEPAI